MSFVFFVTMASPPEAPAAAVLEASCDKLLAHIRALHHFGPSVDVAFDLTVTHGHAWHQSLLSALRGSSKAPPPDDTVALSRVRGTARAGTATLVLGNPGAGRSTLLGAIAGLPVGKVSSDGVRWNGLPPASCGGVPHKLGALVHQSDVFEPLLTVRETLTFAAAAALAELPPDASAAARALREGAVELVIDALGLRGCADVIVGDVLRRGVSGGQRKRVALGEAMLSDARVLCCDEVTNGLDAETGLVIVRFLCAWAHTTGGTLVCALQAPSSDVTALFDQLVLLSDGHCLYAGPPAECLKYFANKGYVAPAGMTVAEYGVALAISPAFARTGSPDDTPPPAHETREALADAWAAHAAAVPADPAARAPLTGGVVLTTTLDKRQFGRTHVHSAWRHVLLLVHRQAQLTRRDRTQWLFKVLIYATMAALYGSVFQNINPNNYNLIFGFINTVQTVIAFGGMQDLPAAFAGKRSALRQLERGLYPSFSYVLSVILNAQVFNTAAAIVVALIMYAISSLPYNIAWGFFVLQLIAFELAVTQLYRLLAYSFHTLVLAQLMAGLATMIMATISGYTITINVIESNSPEFLPLCALSWLRNAAIPILCASELYPSPSSHRLAQPLLVDAAHTRDQPNDSAGLPRADEAEPLRHHRRHVLVAVRLCASRRHPQVAGRVEMGRLYLLRILCNHCGPCARNAHGGPCAPRPGAWLRAPRR